MRNRLHFLWFMCLVVLVPAADLSARPRTFVAGQNVRMKTEVPAGYSFKSESGENGMVQIMMENPVWSISLRVLISREYSAATERDEWQRNLVVSQSADFLAQSKEQDYKFAPLNPAQGSGVFCIFTDSEAKRVEDLKPGEVLHAVVGAKVIPGAVMYFQIMCNDVKSPEYAEVFDLLVNGFDEA